MVQWKARLQNEIFHHILCFNFGIGFMRVHQQWEISSESRGILIAWVIERWRDGDRQTRNSCKPNLQTQLISPAAQSVKRKLFPWLNQQAWRRESQHHRVHHRPILHELSEAAEAAIRNSQLALPQHARGASEAGKNHRDCAGDERSVAAKECRSVPWHSLRGSSSRLAQIHAAIVSASLVGSQASQPNGNRLSTKASEPQRPKRIQQGSIRSNQTLVAVSEKGKWRLLVSQSLRNKSRWVMMR